MSPSSWRAVAALMLRTAVHQPLAGSMDGALCLSQRSVSHPLHTQCQLRGSLRCQLAWPWNTQPMPLVFHVSWQTVPKRRNQINA